MIDVLLMGEVDGCDVAKVRYAIRAREKRGPRISRRGYEIKEEEDTVFERQLLSRRRISSL
jgi:hypothetical protein